MPKETWVRPPVHPTEAPHRAFATWRYRVVAVLLLAVVVYAFIRLFLQFSDVTGGEDPGLIGLPAAATLTATVTTTVTAGR